MAFIGESLGEGRGRRLDLDLDEPIALDADGDLDESAVSPANTMDRQRVEDLVRRG